MKKRWGNLARMLSIFIPGVGLIIVYKTFDNLGAITVALMDILRILTPFVVGLGIAFVLYAPSNWIEIQMKKSRFSLIVKHSRTLSVTVVYFVLIALLALLIAFGIPALIKALISFITSLPVYYKQLLAFFERFTEKDGWLYGFDITKTIESLYTDYIAPKLTVENVLSYFKGIMNFTSSLLSVFMAFIISVYMLISRESLLRASKMILGLFIPDRWMSDLSRYTHRSCDILYSYFYTQALDAVVVAVLMSIGMVIFRAPSPLVLGSLIGIMNMIPYFGAYIGGGVAIALTLLSGGFYKALFVTIYIIAMQQLDANLIQPRIVSDKLGLRPIYVLFGITLGSGLFGFWGIFLGVPATAIVQMLLRDYIAYRKRVKTSVIRTTPRVEWHSPTDES